MTPIGSWCPFCAHGLTFEIVMLAVTFAHSSSKLSANVAVPTANCLADPPYPWLGGVGERRTTPVTALGELGLSDRLPSTPSCRPSCPEQCRPLVREWGPLIPQAGFFADH